MTDHLFTTEVVLTSDLFDDCLDVESLSPAAEVVLDAYMKGFGWLDSPTKKDGRCIATTLRAVADVIDFDPWLQEHADYCTKLRAIAAELDPLPLPSGEVE